MLRAFCKSKIHRARVTETNLEYEGSLTLAEDLMEAAELLPFEKVQVVNLQNGSRIETYLIPGQRGSGTVCLNGGAAYHGQVGDELLIISYVWLNEEEAARHQPRLVFLDAENRLLPPNPGEGS